MDLQTIFARLGFGKNAHKVYRLLLKHKEGLLVAHIASGLGIDRPEVYRNLKQLLKHHFVDQSPLGKRTLYIAKSPKHIKDEFELISTKVGNVTQKIQKEMSDDIPTTIRYLKGFSGIRAVFDDVITNTKRGGTFYRYTSENDLARVNKYLSPNYRENRDKKKLERLVISNPASGKQKKSRLERFIKYIPTETVAFDQNIIQLIYGEHVAFINLNTEEAFVIKDPVLASFQAVIFNQLYKKL